MLFLRNFYNIDVVTRDSRIGSKDQCTDSKNIFAKKIGENWRFSLKQLAFWAKIRS
jgi:hypothetical protein